MRSHRNVRSRPADEEINQSYLVLYVVAGSEQKPFGDYWRVSSHVLTQHSRLKCDRHQPCKTCVDRGLSLSCTYTRHVPGPTPESKVPHNVHDRIDQLEKLVTSLMGEKNQTIEKSPVQNSHPPQPYPGEASTDAQAAGAPDHVKLGDDATSYTNSSHWTSLLDGITELRDELDRIPETSYPRDPSHAEILGPDLFFGAQRHATLKEILAAMPPRAEADHLVASYFNSVEMAPAIIHKPTFFREVCSLLFGCEK